MWWDYWPMPFFFGPLFMIMIAAICAVMMILMMRSHRHGKHRNALDILRERYAGGEIDRSGGAYSVRERHEQLVRRSTLAQCTGQPSFNMSSDNWRDKGSTSATRPSRERSCPSNMEMEKCLDPAASLAKI